MLDIQLIRDHPEQIKKSTENKGCNPMVVDEVLRLDKERRELISKVEKLRAEKNKISKEKTDQSIDQGRMIKKQLNDFEPRLKRVGQDLNELLLRIPNPAAEDVLVGKDESGNKIIRRWGNPTQFSFEPKDHLELGELLDIIDVNRASKVSGARFNYLRNEAVLLEFALIKFALERLIKANFIPIIPPVLIKKEAMEGMGYTEHGGKEDMFILDKDNLILIGTSEQSIGPMHMGEVFNKDDLPKRYAGFSNCFRREAGSYGKDTRGILRVHQFDKIEMFSFITPEKADEEHEFLLSLEEEFLQQLKLPYQVIKMCTGDLGAPAARKYDLEAWIPTQKKYRELTSTSTTTDFQARRLNIRYRHENKTEFVHMLNGTAFAIGRTIIAILENYQQEDGSVAVPEVLQNYLGKEVIKPHS